MPGPEIDLLLAALDEAFDRRSWHGPNLRGSLRRVDAATAAWRPAAGRHNVWELAVHCAYWKYAVWRRVTGEKRGSFALAGSNWFARPLAGAAGGEAWKADLRRLVDEHARLREAVAALAPRDLARRTPGSPFPLGRVIQGAAAHDLYHAGQIQLLKRLAAGAERGVAAILPATDEEERGDA